MTPSQLASTLRSIASRIDASNQPSRARVASALKDILIRLASRTDVLRQVEATFTGQDVYPPKLNSIGDNKYEGDIDTGWKLEVEEMKDGSLKTKLNNIDCPSVKDAAIAYKKKDPKFLPTKPTSPVVIINDPRIKKFEHIVWGRTTPFPEDERGSQLFWKAFEELDMVDWTPWTDVEQVVKKVRELAYNLRINPDREEKSARDNYRSFKDFAWTDGITETIKDQLPDLISELPDGFTV